MDDVPVPGRHVELAAQLLNGIILARGRFRSCFLDASNRFAFFKSFLALFGGVFKALFALILALCSGLQLTFGGDSTVKSIGFLALDLVLAHGFSSCGYRLRGASRPSRRRNPPAFLRAGHGFSQIRWNLVYRIGNQEFQ